MSLDTSSTRILITGGAGFIGSNLAERLLRTPRVTVRIFDNLSRRGAEQNLEWLRRSDASNRLEFTRGDVRDTRAVKQAVEGASAIFHFAAQVAVTTSVEDPTSDFKVNAEGTFNVLEAARTSDCHPFVLFTSTNKVYGSLEGIDVDLDGTHYRASEKCPGVNESEPLDFHSPYGCSKGAADQYVRDYARIYNIPAVVFRMSCIAGPRQFGNEDQGWVAHFLYSVLEGQPITVYGDGFQVRDILHVHDLVDAMLAVYGKSAHTRGEIFNLGGGLERSISVIEMLRRIESITGKPLCIIYRDTRPGDQPWYVADTSKLERFTGWRARRTIDDILSAINQFWSEKRARVSLKQRSSEFTKEVA